MKRSVCFTSCNNAYLDRAAVLAKTFKQHHEDWRFVVLLSNVLEDSEIHFQEVPDIDDIVPIYAEVDLRFGFDVKQDSEELCRR